MTVKPLFAIIIACLAAGCATTQDDPVRLRNLAEIEKARAAGQFPITEAQYVFPLQLMQEQQVHAKLAGKAP